MRVALYGSTTVSETLGEGMTEKVTIILSGYSSRILEMRRVPMPDPVPPPREWVTWNPWRQSQPSASLRTTSRTESMSSAPSESEPAQLTVLRKYQYEDTEEKGSVRRPSSQWRVPDHYRRHRRQHCLAQVRQRSRPVC